MGDPTGAMPVPRRSSSNGPPLSCNASSRQEETTREQQQKDAFDALRATGSEGLAMMCIIFSWRVHDVVCVHMLSIVGIMIVGVYTLSNTPYQ